ncbi:MAG TPA: hypothetical protein VEK08_09715 [Planctomycetota bacterium]|nr:hypothetical protein [Planctomycetota bacterium]
MHLNEEHEDEDDDVEEDSRLDASLVEQPKSLAQRTFDDFGELVVAVIYFGNIVVIFVTANAIFGPTNLLLEFSGTICIALAVTSIRSYVRLQNYFWTPDPRDPPWYVSRFVLVSLLLCVVVVFLLELFNYQQKLAAAEYQRQQQVQKAKMQTVQQSPKYQKGLEMLEELERRKQEKRQKQQAQ